MPISKNSGQRFITRNRKPRVHITYENPFKSDEKYELPFVMGVLADLSGNASKVEKPLMDKRKFVDFDMDNFDRRMDAIKPAISFMAPNKLGPDAGGEKLSVRLEFSKMEDFSPASVARKVDSTRKLLEAREQLANLLLYMDGKLEAEGELKRLLGDKKLMEMVKTRLAAPAETDADQG